MAGSRRFRAVSGRVGIDVTMRAHQLAAWGVLLFLLVHPSLYAVPRLTPDPMRAVTFIERMFTSDWYRSGVIAWLLLLALVPMGMLRQRRPLAGCVQGAADRGRACDACLRLSGSARRHQ
jgi:hypothetical protein